MKKSQQRINTVVEIQFGIVLLGFGLRSILKNTTQSSLKDIGNSTLPPLHVVPSYSIVRSRPIRDRYVNNDSFAHAFSVFEGVDTS